MFDYEYEKPLEAFTADDFRSCIAYCGLTGVDVGKILGLGKKAGNARLNHPDKVTSTELTSLLEAIRSKTCERAVEGGIFSDLTEAQGAFDRIGERSLQNLRDILNASKRILSLEKDSAIERFKIAAACAWGMDKRACYYSEEKVRELEEDQDMDLMEINLIIYNMNADERHRLHDYLVKKYPDYLMENTVT